MTTILSGWHRGDGTDLAKTFTATLRGDNLAAATAFYRQFTFGSTGGPTPGFYETIAEANGAQAPLATELLEERVAAVAQGADLESEMGLAPFTGTVTRVRYSPDLAITGVNTDTRKVVVVNKGSAGSGTTIVATLQFDHGVDAGADDEVEVTLSTTSSDLAVTAGDVLVWQSTHVGAGIADPGGLASVEVTDT